MSGEFMKRIKLIALTEEEKKKVTDLIEEAGREFPCLACSSNETCENFKWYIKWFRES
jgi:hypothetical protein